LAIQGRDLGWAQSRVENQNLRDVAMEIPLVENTMLSNNFAVRFRRLSTAQRFRSQADEVPEPV